MKILIIKLGALGDMIISTAIIKQILKHHCKDKINLLTTPSYNDLFSNFDKLLVTTFERKGLLNAINTVKWIRKQQFDRIYDLQSNDRSSLYCAFSGVSFRVGNHPRFPYHAHPENKYRGECHSFERLNQIIKSAGIEPAEPLPFLPVPEVITQQVNNWLDKRNLAERSFAVMHAGSSPSHTDKRWPYFLKLAKKLDKKMEIVWIGSNDDQTLNEKLTRETGINATNEFSIHGLVALGKRARFAITNDSAPMHILSCAKIPVFGLFGPTYARRTHALGQLNNVITPNNHIAENDQDFSPQDITGISVDAVLNKLSEQKLI